MQELKKVVVIGPESTGKSTLCRQLADHYQTLWCPEYARDYLLEHGTNYTYNDLLTIAKGQLALENTIINQIINRQQIPNHKSQIPNHKSQIPNSSTTNYKLQTTDSNQIPNTPTTNYKLQTTDPNQIPNSSTDSTTNYKLQTTNSLLFIDTDMYVMKVWCEYVFNKCHLFILDKIVEQTCDLYLLCNTDLPWVKDELREYPDLHSRKELYHIYKDILINQQVPWVDISGAHNERLNTAIKAVDALLTS